MARWTGDPVRFPHLNSCAIVARDLVCAASNYPVVPMASRIEFFDPVTLRHRRTIALGSLPGSLPGSLTVIDRHGGAWWAVLANYDGRGGAPGRDHRQTVLVKLDRHFRSVQTWRFPAEVLARFAPRSCSGAAWGKDGLLYASGHDRTEIYGLRLPASGDVLELVRTVPVPTAGQAIDWDPAEPNLLWSIDRKGRRLVATRIARPR